ncbi:hypothetical protein STRIP9103_08420 [Streptomyces ipomoeae 91-03]|uniref:Uncharacterized protein n=1 Tax=Streptomyces ipomoeae 91-03 TaxID=698759 RepID=L1KXS1_9ACTN|nr:hypothetical protein STRIP9103_08420 [Streptomyces ipomoeae 91-03]
MDEAAESLLQTLVDAALPDSPKLRPRAESRGPRAEGEGGGQRAKAEGGEQRCLAKPPWPSRAPRSTSRR